MTYNHPDSERSGVGTRLACSSPLGRLCVLKIEWWSGETGCALKEPFVRTPWENGHLKAFISLSRDAHIGRQRDRRTGIQIEIPVAAYLELETGCRQHRVPTLCCF